MEESTAKKLLAEVKEIKTALIGNPEFQQKGLIHEVSQNSVDIRQNSKDIQEIKDNGVRIKWFWMGGAAAAGGTAGILGKSTLGKALTAIGAFFAGK